MDQPVFPLPATQGPAPGQFVGPEFGQFTLAAREGVQTISITSAGEYIRFPSPTILTVIDTTGYFYLTAGLGSRTATFESKNGSLALPVAGAWFIKFVEVTQTTTNATRINVLVEPVASDAGIIARDFKTLQISYDAKVLIANADTLALAANARRRYLFLQNLSNNNMFVAFKRAAETLTGYFLPPGGGNKEWINPQDPVPVTEVRAFASAADSELSVIEGV